MESESSDNSTVSESSVEKSESSDNSLEESGTKTDFGTSVKPTESGSNVVYSESTVISTQETVYSTDSPETGENGESVILFALTSVCAASLLILFSRRGKKAKN